MEASPVNMSAKRSSIPAPSSAGKGSPHSASAIPSSPARGAHNSPFTTTQSPLRKQQLMQSPQLGSAAIKPCATTKECPNAGASSELAHAQSMIPAYSEWNDENMQNQGDEDPVAQLFWQDSDFVSMCEDGLTRGLTRTKDGGRKDKELAALVKTLRKCVRGYNERLTQLQQHMQQRAPGTAAPTSPGELAALRSKLSAAEAALAHSQSGMAEELSAVEAERDALRRRVEAQAAPSEPSAEVVALRATLLQRESRLQALDRQLAEAAVPVATEAHEQVAALRRELEAAQAAVAQERAQAVAAAELREAQGAEAAEELHRARATVAEQGAQLETVARSDALHRADHNAAEQLEHARGTIARLEHELHIARAQAEGGAGEITRLEAALIESERQRSAAEAVEAEASDQRMDTDDEGGGGTVAREVQTDARASPARDAEDGAAQRASELEAALRERTARVAALEAEARAMRRESDTTAARGGGGGDVAEELRQERVLRLRTASEFSTFRSQTTDDKAKWARDVRAVEEELGRTRVELRIMREARDRLRLGQASADAARQRAEAEAADARRLLTEARTKSHKSGEIWEAMMQAKAEREREVAELQERIAAEAAAKDTAATRADTLEGACEGLRAEVSLAQRRMADAQAEHTQLQGQLLDAAGERAQLEEQLAAADAEVGRARREADDAAGARGASDAAATAAEARHAEAAAQLDAQAARAAALQADADDKAAQVAHLQKRVAKAKEALGLMEDRCKQLEEVVRSHEEALATNASALAGRDAEVDDLRRMMAREQEAAATVAARAGELERALAERDERAASLESQMEALQGVVGCGDQAEMVHRLVEKVGNLEASLLECERVRRGLHNDLVELRGNIRVYARIRPTPRAPVAEATAADSLRLMVDAKPNDFFFDKVLGPSATQEDVFGAVADVVQSALDGYHVCLFSYGQTGSGKTHTMNGPAGCEAQRGIIPRAITKILEAAARLRGVGWEFALEATFVEIYNEALRDLLGESAPGRPGKALDGATIKHSPGGHTEITGATRVEIDGESTAHDVIRRAARARATDATAMNATSSRSHSVFSLHITSTHAESDLRLLGSLHLVDLAGSERLARSGAEGTRQRETCAINKSLSSLGDVFQALASKAPHVPFRNSKLTYLLRDCLGGDGKTLMFVNVNPEPESAFESLCALRFAAKVNAVETAARGGAKRNASCISDAGPLSAPLPPRPSLAPPRAGGPVTRQSVVPGRSGSAAPRASIAPAKRGASTPQRPSAKSSRTSSLPAAKRR